MAIWLSLSENHIINIYILLVFLNYENIYVKIRNVNLVQKCETKIDFFMNTDWIKSN